MNAPDLHDQHIQAMEMLPEPTKSLAINVARAGSLADITALNEHILSMTTCPPLWCYLIVTTIVHFLAEHRVPDEISEFGEESSDLVIQVRRLLEILSQLARLRGLSGDQYFPRLSNYILANHDCIFPWLDFLQRSFFGRSDPIAADDERRMTFTLAWILHAVERCRHNVDYTKHRTLGEMVIHIWHKLLRMELFYLRPSEESLAIVVAVDNILPMYLFMPTLADRPRPQYVMDAVGGPSAVIAFTLARLERDTMFLSRNLTIPCLGITGGFTNLTSFLGSPDYCHDILDQRVVTRSVYILTRLISSSPALPSDSPPVSAKAIDTCIMFMTSCVTFGPEVVKEVLDSGLIPILRTGIIQPSPSHRSSNELLCYLLIFNFIYPSIIRHSRKRMKVTPPLENCPMPDLWRLYDAYVSAYTYLWDRAGSMARKFDKCATCQLSGRDHYLKVCAGCRVNKYCSSKCQRMSWERGHRIHCSMFRLSHLTQPKQITSCRNFLYLALVEHFELHNPSTRSQIEAEFANNLPLAATDEIPLLAFSANPAGCVTQVEKMSKFPEIFGTRSWKLHLLPKFRQLVLTGGIKYLTVMVCPTGLELQNVLGALSSTIASGMVDSKSWDREAENYGSIRPGTWPEHWSP